jgi:quinol monooxygenase YgiN
MIAIIGQFDVHPEDTEQVAEVMRVMMTETVKEQGCQHYAFARDLTNANRFQLSELWDGNEVLTAHFATPHMAAFRGGLSKLRIQNRTVTRYDISGGNPL